MRLRKYEAKIDVAAAATATAAALPPRSNLLGAVVFPPRRISRLLSGEMFALRRRWKFLRDRGEADIGEDFFARAKSSSGEQVEMSGNDRTAHPGNWPLHDG